MYTPAPQQFQAERLRTDKKLTEEQLQLIGASLSTLAIPPATISPFSGNLTLDTTKIKQQEAQRMFPDADPNLFNKSRQKEPIFLAGGLERSPDFSPTIPLNQRYATSRVFNKKINRNSPLSPEEIYKSRSSFPEYLTGRPGPPSPELGSFANAISNKTIFPEGDIQAITVTPGPNPGRFAQDYAEILADKLGKTLNEYEKAQFNSETNVTKLQNKIKTLTNKTPGTAGYIWGNIQDPQYSYAEGNWGLGQKLAGENPSIYLSRINADPSNEARYLYTSDILKGKLEPRAPFKQYEDLGLGTGPSWGVAPNKDISFRKDLIGARGELTTGDLQALLAERGLPFKYQTQGGPESRKRPGDILEANLETLASSENISPSQAAEKYARLIPNVGEPSTPPTTAVSAKRGEFPVQEQMASPFGHFASKTDLRQLGILPRGDKAQYSPFAVDEFTAQPNINRDALRPLAANKLLNKTVANLIEQSKPIQGLGLGGLAAGAIGTAMDPAVIDALARGDYQQAGTTAAFNTAVGSAVGGGTAKALQGLRAAGYARPAAIVGGGLPVAAGALGGLGIIETSRALNRAYKGQTGKDWITRNQPASPNSTYTGPTPTIQPRMAAAILNGKTVQVPYGSVAGTRTVGRPWWDKAGSNFQNLLNRFNAGSIIGR